jgi:hypothetical protein
MRTLIAGSLLLAGGAALATEPLPDRIWYQSRPGSLYQQGKGALPLPPSARLQALAMAQSCSALGGPRGVYRYGSGKLWLVGLHGCSGGINLVDVYPAMSTPPVAHWINGILHARLGGNLCAAKGGPPIFEHDVTLRVENGEVTAITEKLGDPNACLDGKV